MENVLFSMLVWFWGLKKFFFKLSCYWNWSFLLVCGSMILKTCTDSCNHNYDQDTEQFYHPPQFSQAHPFIITIILPPSLTPKTHWYVFHPYSIVFSRMLLIYKWNHTVWNLFMRLASFLSLMPCSILLLCSSPWYESTTVCLPIHLVNDIWNVFQLRGNYEQNFYKYLCTIQMAVFMLTYVFIFLRQITMSGIVILHD